MYWKTKSCIRKLCDIYMWETENLVYENYVIYIYGKQRTMNMKTLSYIYLGKSQLCIWKLCDIYTWGKKKYVYENCVIYMYGRKRTMYMRTMWYIYMGKTHYENNVMYICGKKRTMYMKPLSYIYIWEKKKYVYENYVIYIYGEERSKFLKTMWYVCMEKKEICIWNYAIYIYGKKRTMYMKTMCMKRGLQKRRIERVLFRIARRCSCGKIDSHIWIYISIYINACFNIHMYMNLWKKPSCLKRGHIRDRDLYIWKNTHKRDLYLWKETYIYEKRLLRMGKDQSHDKRPIYVKRDPLKRPTYMERDIYVWKETYV